jgi:hypothetical protein
VSQPAAAPQERDYPKGVARDASPEIQEVGEGSSVAVPRDVESDDARVLDLVRVPWAAAFEVGDDTEDDEESVACNILERKLAWARRAFELILPAMSVSFLCTNDSSLISSALLRSVAYIQLVGADTRGMPVGDAVGRGSCGRCRSGGERVDDAGDY